jgi:hypothetical protein
VVVWGEMLGKRREGEGEVKVAIISDSKIRKQQIFQGL